MDTQSCPQCSKPFAPDASHRVYCSRACYTAAREPGTRPCLQCGEEFSLKNNKRGLFCRRACYVEHRWGAKTDRSVDLRNCLVCGKEFQNHRVKRPAAYCSRDCYFASRVGMPKPTLQRRQIKTCPQCNKNFEVGGSAGNANKRFCSVGCAGTAKIEWRTCLSCGVQFKNKQKRKYCTRSCYADAQRQIHERSRTLTCERCGKEFQRFESQIRDGQTLFYCSGDCRADSRVYAIGADNAQWQGGTYVTPNGYLYELDRSLGKNPSGGNRYRGQHIRIAEQHLGRELQKGEHVHHLNGNKLDNNPENLLVLGNGMHRKLHGFYSNQFQQEHAEKGDLTALTLAFLATIT